MCWNDVPHFQDVFVGAIPQSYVLGGMHAFVAGVFVVGLWPVSWSGLLSAIVLRL